MAATAFVIEPSAPIGAQLKQWRTHRRMSQLDLALDAEISTRHLSFVETGRARPSRTMVLNLAERLRIPNRERNGLLLAAGYAPAFPHRALDDPSLKGARDTISRLLTGYGAFPALAVDRHWTLVEANAAVMALVGGVAPHLLTPPVNVLRLSLHPEGLAPAIANLPVWRGAIFSRLREQIETSADPVLADLLEELRALPGGEAPMTDLSAAIAIPMLIDSPVGRLSLIGAVTIFGTPVDVTLSELAIEAFLPADG